MVFFQKKFLYIFLISLTLSSCFLVDVSKRGENIFQNIDTVSVDSEVKDLDVELDEETELMIWPTSDFYSEVGPMNHFFTAGYEVMRILPLRQPKLLKIKQTEIMKDRNARLKMRGRYIYLKQPIFFYGTIVISDQSGVVSAFDVEDDYFPIWEFSLRKILKKDMKSLDQISLSYGDKKVVIVTNNGYIICLDSKTGELIWLQKKPFSIRAPLKYAIGRLYGLSNENYFFILDSKTGEELFHNSASSAQKFTKTQPSILIGNSSAIAGYNTGDIVAFDLQSGQIKWVHDLSQGAGGLFSMSDIDFIPAFVNGMIIAGTINGTVYMMRESDGRVMWVKNISLGSHISVSGEFIFFVDSNDNLICMHWPSSNVKWVTKLPSFDKLLVPKYLNDGKKWKTTSILKSGPMISDDKILVFTNMGELMLFNPQNGQKIESFLVPYGITDATIANGNIYSISKEKKKLIVIE